MNWIRDAIPQPQKNRIFRLALLVTILGNLVLAIGKALAAYFSGSVALYSEAANSISDVLYSIMMVLGLWLSQQPPDISHPQGHSRFEPLVGLVITLSMVLAGYAAASASIKRFLSGGIAVDPGLPTIILISSALIKVGMYIYIRRLAYQAESPTLTTAAADNLMDVLASSAALIGALGSFYWHPLFDPVAGILIAVWIFRAAFEAGKENLGYLTGRGASEELRQQIVDIASSVPGVLQVHQVVTEYAGPHLIVDMHINVDGEITLNEAHLISDQVIDALEILSEIDRAYVHLEPEGWHK